MSKVLFISILGFLLTSGVAMAAVPETNRMQLAEISDSLPVPEIRAFYTKMEPLMLKIFGPPFSNVNLKIEANLNGTVHDTGYTDNEQTLVFAGQARDYQKNKARDPKHALEQIYSNMMHELSHGMYYYGNKRVLFHPQWVNEGWVKLQEIMLAKELGIYSFGTRPYFNYYLDRDTIAGTANWGSSKQVTNHSIVYDVTSVTHLTLLALSTPSNDNYAFFKTFNNKVYDWVKANGQTDISLEQYKDIMRELLVGKIIDGQSAFDWYFNNPDTLTQGKLGNHLGIVTEPGEIIAYAFSRAGSGRDIKETALPNLDITIKAVDYNGKILLEKTVKTDFDGNARAALPKNGDSTIMTLDASATIEGKPFTANTFYFDGSPQENILSGVLIDEAGKPLSAKCIGLLTSDLAFEYKDKGVFLMTVPNTTRTVTLDFLGFKQEVTKGPFARMFAMTVPAKYVEEASQQTDETFSGGIINNLRAPADKLSLSNVQKNPALVVGVVSLIAVLIGAVVIVKSSLIKFPKLRVANSLIVSTMFIFFSMNFNPRNVDILATRSFGRIVLAYLLNIILFFIIIYLIATVVSLLRQKMFKKK